jgi:1-aminocyclopropane-1-carboxylate deaminase/D-cysteine desulfhydrase-like pyridoxal-dependent ACC family enzyme
MGGLFDLVRRGVLDPAVPTVFLHTGGVPIVFAFESTFRDQAICTKITR